MPRQGLGRQAVIAVGWLDCHAGRRVPCRRQARYARPPAPGGRGGNAPVGGGATGGSASGRAAVLCSSPTGGCAAAWRLCAPLTLRVPGCRETRRQAQCVVI